MQKYFIFISTVLGSLSVPPPIDFAYKFDGKQCLHIKMRLSLTLGDSEFLINQNSITGNCSEVTIGWPEPPFPLLGRINLKFNMEKNAEGVEHAGLRYLEVVVQNNTYAVTLSDQLIGAPLGQSFFCNTGFSYRLCPIKKPICELNIEAVNLKFTDVRFQPYQIESKSGFDNPSYCENDIRVIFPAFVAVVSLVVAAIVGVYLYQSKKKRQTFEETTYREL